MKKVMMGLVDTDKYIMYFSLQVIKYCYNKSFK